MLTWSEVWPERRCFVSIHLPEHGRSGYVGEGGEDREGGKGGKGGGIIGEGGERGWGGGQAIPPGLWGVIARRIADREGAAAGPMDLLGYSIGGRVAMAALVASPSTWGRVVLLAPDGLRKAPLYGLTVHTQVGRWIWRVLDRRAERVLRVWDRLHRWGLIPKHLHGFAHFHLDRAEMRRMVWRGWRAHRDCWAREAEVAAAMRDHGAPVDLCFGAHDQVIPVRNGRGLAWRLRRMGAKGVRFHVLPAGHNMQRPDVMKTVVERIFQR